MSIVMIRLVVGAFIKWDLMFIELTYVRQIADLNVLLVLVVVTQALHVLDFLKHNVAVVCALNHHHAPLPLIPCNTPMVGIIKASQMA